MSESDVVQHLLEWSEAVEIDDLRQTLNSAVELIEHQGREIRRLEKRVTKLRSKDA